MNFVNQFWLLIVESAPWLLAGYFLAGVINEVIPGAWVKRQLAAKSPLAVIKGALIGAPLPLCSCGVIPTAVAIRKAGASKGASASFLVATPETGVDSVAFSYAVLGPLYAIVRPIAAISSAITTGLLVNVMDKQDTLVPQEEKPGCCSHKQAASPTLPEKVLAAFKYGYGKMIGDTATWLLIGFLAAAAVTTWVPQAFFTQWGTGIGAMLIMVLIGLPMYICATASTPIAASFLFAGISPGAALVFLLTGPATNVATMGIVKQHLGGRSLVAYLLGVIGTAVFFGLALNYFVALNDWQFEIINSHSHEHISLWRQIAALALSLLVLRIFVLKGMKRYSKFRISKAESASAEQVVTEQPKKCCGGQ